MRFLVREWSTVPGFITWNVLTARNQNSEVKTPLPDVQQNQMALHGVGVFPVHSIVFRTNSDGSEQRHL
jgi:hypothetical protein